MTRIGDKIHQSFVEAVRSRSLAGEPDIEGLPGRLRDLARPDAERDLLWIRLLDHIADGPRQDWAAVLLEAIRPDLAAVAVAVPALPPEVDLDDVDQHLIAQVLSTALEGPVEPPRWTPNRLITRAKTSLYRWLDAELLREADELPLLPDDRDRSAEARLDLVELKVDLEASRVRARAVYVVYQQVVIGESLDTLADRAGVSKNALRLRQRRALDRLRRQLAA